MIREKSTTACPVRKPYEKPVLCPVILVPAEHVLAACRDINSSPGASGEWSAGELCLVAPCYIST